MKKTDRKVRAGFTMVELMAVLIILGLLATVVVRNFMGQTDKARVITTKANLKTLHYAVKQFKMETGRYPTEEDGLEELIVEPGDVENWQPDGYLDSSEIPEDGWGEEFIYERYPEGGGAFVIKSYGADKEEGGEDYDADLFSTDVR